MKRKAIAGLLLASLFAAGAALCAETPCGMVSYCEGSALLTHNGKQGAIEIGDAIYDGDLVQTKDRSRLEIDMQDSTGFSGSVKVSAKTSFYFNLKQTKGQPSTNLELLGGQLAMKVKKLSGSPSAQVRTETAVAGVRGTEFVVQVTLGGDLLISCDLGAVEVVGDDGETVEAPAGTVVDKESGEKFTSQAVGASGLDEFRQRWFAERMEALKADPSRALRQFSRYYLASKAGLDRDIAALERDSTLRRWMQNPEAENGGRLEKRNLEALKKLDRPMLDAKKTLFLFERYYYRLAELEELLSSDPALMSRAIDPAAGGKSLTVAEFFRRFRADRAELSRKIAFYRFAAKVYEARKPAGFGSLDAGDSGQESSDDFFAD
jgi:hypothetical protein